MAPPEWMARALMFLGQKPSESPTSEITCCRVVVISYQRVHHQV